jgi:heptosyltransferase I
MHVLIVKLTSMGDLIHALPALTDAQRAIPGIRFDWVVDEAFADIPRMHPAVDQIITTAHRRWQREKLATLKSGELFSVAKTIRAKHYDAVIDAQNNLKSAVVTMLTRGTRYGMDKDSTREKFADWVCDKTFSIPVNQHAITRQRQLFAKALNYPLPDTFPDFGIDLDQLPAVSLSLPKPYLAFVHSTTWDTKHWPEHYWKLLINRAVAAGYHIILPWGSAQEAERAARLAETDPAHCTVLPKLSISEQATVLSGAAGAVCVDTGLGHLTAALNVPAVHLYGPTDPALIGATGLHQTHLVAEYECAPCYLHHCQFGAESACFLAHMKPEKVFAEFIHLISMH